MGLPSFTASHRDAFRKFIARLSPNPPCPEIPNLKSSKNDDTNDYEEMCVDSDDKSDEGFHEEWPPFSPKDLMSFMTIEQATSTFLYQGWS
jgi:hypothetical protein